MGATSVRYGGTTFSPPDVRTPVPMGNGFSPNFFLKKACLFEHLQIVNEKNQLVDIDPKMVHDFSNVGAQCYGLVDFNDAYHGQAFSFGGPGGSCP